MESLKERAEEGDAVDFSVKALDHAGSSIRVTIPSTATEVLKIEPGDELPVELHGDHVRFYPEG